MKNDRRPEFEKDLLFMMDKDNFLPADNYVKIRNAAGGYDRPEINQMYVGWCLSKDAEIKRHEQYTANRLALLDSNPVMQPLAILCSHDETFAAPPGFKWCVNFVTANQWPQSATLVGGVQYSLHESSGAPYIDVVLFQTDNATEEAVYEAKALYRKLSDAFHVKTHFEYEEGGHTHRLTRLTLQHEEFVRLQNV